MKALPDVLAGRLEVALGGPITASKAVGGGSINEAAAIVCGGQRLFVKWNGDPLPGLFAKEAHGLEVLRATGILRVPEPIVWAEAEAGCPAFLVMEHIEAQAGFFDRDAFGKRFGEALARLHQDTGPVYGLDRDNYIGSLPQPNARSDSWAGFFAEQRLGAQRKIAIDRGTLRPKYLAKVDKLIERLPDLLPDTPGASLLHGDLWSGNYLVGPDGEPVIIDPAVYRGHREVELAFTELFGGFPASFYDTYKAVLPLDGGYESRRRLYNTYPLMVHVNLFGGGYVKQLMRVVESYV